MTNAPSTTAPTIAPTTTIAATTTTTEPLPPHLVEGADVLFDDDAMHTFEISVAKEKLAILDEDPSAEEYVDGSFAFNGTKIGPVGVRYKGSIGAFLSCTEGGFRPSGTKTCRKLSIKLKVNWDDPDATFYGVRRLQFHAMSNDPTRMHDRLGYWMFREMGVPASRATHARIVINGEFVGVFSLVENVDGRFADDRFDDGSGNVYSDIWPFDLGGIPKPADALIAKLETNEGKGADVGITTTFAAEVAAASPDDRKAIVERGIDVDAFLRYVVVDRAIKHEDGALRWYCREGPCGPHNFFWYENPSTRQLTLIPWDLDFAFSKLTDENFIVNVISIADEFGTTSHDCQPYASGQVGLVQVSAACDPIVAAVSRLTDEYDAIRAELLAGPLSAVRVGEMLDKWSAQIETALIEESATHGDVDVAAWRAAVQRLEDGLAQARVGSGR